MVTIERAALPPERKPKLSDALIDQCKREGLTPDVDAIKALDSDGWTSAIDGAFKDAMQTGVGTFVAKFDNSNIAEVGKASFVPFVEVKRYPTNGFSLMIGGKLNGKECDLRSCGDAKFVAILVDADKTEWYERTPGGYVWIASVTAEGFTLRETAI